MGPATVAIIAPALVPATTPAQRGVEDQPNALPTTAVPPIYSNIFSFTF